MVQHLVFVVMQCIVAVLCYTKPETICKEGDAKCYTNVFREIIKSTIPEDNELGTKSLDPLYHRVVEGNLPTVKYTLTDTYGVGFKDVILNEIKFVQPNILRFDILLPFYGLTGNYEIKGKLLDTEIEGKGKVFLNATAANNLLDARTYDTTSNMLERSHNTPTHDSICWITADCYSMLHSKLHANFQFHVDTTKDIYEKEGKKHLKLTNLQVNPELLGTMQLDLQNLYNGNKELSEPVLKHLNENYKTVADLLQLPIASANLMTLFNNANKVLAKFPIEDMFELHS